MRFLYSVILSIQQQQQHCQQQQQTWIIFTLYNEKIITSSIKPEGCCCCCCSCNMKANQKQKKLLLINNEFNCLSQKFFIFSSFDFFFVLSINTIELIISIIQSSNPSILFIKRTKKNHEYSMIKIDCQ